jgi:hypothetical protein
MGEQLWMPTTKFKLKLETKLKLKLTHGLMLTPTTIPGGRMKVSRTQMMTLPCPSYQRRPSRHSSGRLLSL